VLGINELSKEVLRGDRSVMISLPNQPQVVTEASSAGRALAEALFDRLRIFRKQIADAQSVAPYIVFADSSLKLMANQQPQTLAEFAEISGVGSRKLAQYGEKFVEEIRAFCQEQDIPLRSAKTVMPTIATEEPGMSHLETRALYQQGLSPAEIAQQRQLKVTTIMHHLEILLEAGQLSDIDRLISPEKQVIIKNAIELVGDSTLKPIYEHLGEEYNYDEIKLVRAAWRAALVV
jgi:ATP-dependent DNA helicase RecQ